MEPVEPRRESAFTVVQFSHAFPILRGRVANLKKIYIHAKEGAIALLKMVETRNFVFYTMPPAA